MGWIISTILAVIVCTLIFTVGKWTRAEGASMAKEAAGESDDSYGRTRRSERLKDSKNWSLNGQLIMIAAVILLGLWIGLSTLITSIHQVPAGHVGVLYEFQAVVGQREEGLNLIPPWQKIVNADTRLQTWMFTDDEDRVSETAGAHRGGNELSSFSKETQAVLIDATLNIEVDPGEIQELYRNVGKDYFGKVVPSRVRQMFKNETVKYTAVEVAPNREKIRADVEALLKTELFSKFSIDVVGLLIDDIDFKDRFKDAIESKQVATQNAQEAKQRVMEAEFKAQQRVKTAAGQAEANRLLDASLSTKVIQYEALQTVRANIETMFSPDSPITIALLPSDQGFIIDPGTLLQTVEPTSAPAGGEEAGDKEEGDEDEDVGE